MTPSPEMAVVYGLGAYLAITTPAVLVYLAVRHWRDRHIINPGRHRRWD